MGEVSPPFIFRSELQEWTDSRRHRGEAGSRKQGGQGTGTQNQKEALNASTMVQPCTALLHPTHTHTNTNTNTHTHEHTCYPVFLWLHSSHPSCSTVPVTGSPGLWKGLLSCDA